MADWPWPDGSSYPSEFLHAFGAEPWDPGRHLGVAVEEFTGEPPSSPEIICSGLLPAPGNPCEDPFEVILDPAADTEVLYLRSVDAPLLHGWELLVEREGDAARVCLVRHTDFRPPACSTSTEGAPVCADAGLVRLDGAHGTIDVSFPGGGTLAASF